MDVGAKLRQLHEEGLRELYATINAQKSALHALVQQAQEELAALAGVPAVEVRGLVGGCASDRACAACIFKPARPSYTTPCHTLQQATPTELGEAPAAAGGLCC
jgi:hypothetical protein